MIKLCFDIENGIELYYNKSLICRILLIINIQLSNDNIIESFIDIYYQNINVKVPSIMITTFRYKLMYKRIRLYIIHYEKCIRTYIVKLM